MTVLSMSSYYLIASVCCLLQRHVLYLLKSIGISHETFILTLCSTMLYVKRSTSQLYVYVIPSHQPLQFPPLKSPGRTEANTPENGKTAKPTVTVQWTTPLEIGTKATGKTEHASATALTTSKTGVCTPVNGEMLLLMAMEE